MEYIKLVKDDQVYMGALYKFESELMKITVKNPEFFQVGDKISCDYSDILFNAKILKKQDSQLYVLVPQTNQQFPNEKRKHPRLKVDLEGTIINNLNANKIKIRVVDISLKGFGILITSSNPLLSVGDLCEFIIQLSEIQLQVTTMIRNLERQDEVNRYGCEIQSISENDEFELRKYILFEQLKRDMAY